MTLALNTIDYAGDRALGVEPPFAGKLLAGHVMGGSVRDTRRSVLPSLLGPASLKGSPTITDNSMICSRANGLRLLTPLPDAFSIIVVVRGHILPVNGDINPLVTDIGLPTLSGQGKGLALGGAAGLYSACIWYEGADGEIKQGAYVSIDGVPGYPSPQFLGGTLNGNSTKVYAGISNELVTSAVTVSDRSIGAWSNKPSFVGTDRRAQGQWRATAAFNPEIYKAFVTTPLTDAEFEAAYRWTQEYASAIFGLAVQ
ncbi:hypothetical protein [uncultured Pseudacidovorax sp.]|uniref:hypothetical protein n=1 Tax=uncultured Pseudacidovorax sp. TaxID=679313 RepID=UPI0025D93098|nr:hypothetical protein [uncultured Pseudacidovorax sp.]